MSVPVHRRVVEVISDRGAESSARYSYGSGFLVRGKTVLTAAHILTDAVNIQIRGVDKVPRVAVRDVALIGDPDHLDLALLDVPDWPEMLPAVTVAIIDRETGRGGFVDDCWSVGYPEFQEVIDRGSVRETAFVGGRIPPLSRLVQGLLSFEVTSSAHAVSMPNDAGMTSPWSGMSGAAVFAGDQLVGVIINSYPRRGTGELVVYPMGALSGPNGPSNAAEWWDRLGVNDPARLPQLGDYVAGSATAELTAVSPKSAEEVLHTAQEPVRVFYSYSHKDERFRERLETQLRLLSRERLLLEWQDRMIGAGEEWREAIRNQLDQADVILLLISPDFLASDFIYEEELATALKRHERGSARVVPIILRPCAWKRSLIGQLQALPKDAKPITTWSNRDSAWTNVGDGLDRLIEDLRPKS
jgi:TIR domain/Trypsin-like peptidase domain